MEITVSKFELLRELTATQGVVERKTTIPILSNYLFEAAGDRLSLTAVKMMMSSWVELGCVVAHQELAWRHSIRVSPIIPNGNSRVSGCDEGGSDPWM